MGERLSGLHHANDRGVNLLLTVLEHALHGLLIFLRGFFDLNRIDLDAEQALVERGVDLEDVARVDVARFRLFVQDTDLGTCERLQRAF